MVLVSGHCAELFDLFEAVWLNIDRALQACMTIKSLPTVVSAESHVEKCRSLESGVELMDPSKVRLSKFLFFQRYDGME